MKRLIGPAAALILGLATPLAISVLPASAAPAHPVHAAQASISRAHQATDPSLGFDVFYPDGSEDILACVRGTNYVLSQDDPYFAVNNCNVRGWFNENLNATGYNFCVSPGDSVNVFRLFTEVSITGNTARCP